MKVSCALIIEKDTVLAVKRGMKKSNPGKWEFPGGKVKNGETLANSLKRELLEELEIEVCIHYQLDPVIYSYPDFKIELYPFVCHVNNGQILLTEHTDMKWCNFDDLDNLDFSDADKQIVQHIKKAGRLPALGNSDKK